MNILFFQSKPKNKTAWQRFIVFVLFDYFTVCHTAYNIINSYFTLVQPYSCVLGYRIMLSFFCENTELDVAFDTSIGGKLKGACRNFGKLVQIMTDAAGAIFTDEESLSDEIIPTNPYSNLENGEEVPFSLSRTYNGAVMITSIISFCLGCLNLLPVVIFDGFKFVMSLFCLAINKDLSQKANIVVAVIGIVLSVIIIF